MATLQELKRQIENANALGIANLTEKGVNVSADATTYDIMQKIVDIVGGGNDSGGGIQYTSVTFNDDDTISLVDSEGNTHAMSYAYENDKLKTITYDGADVPVEYVEELLSKVGGTDIILAQSQVDRLYSHFGVDKTTYPYVAIYTDTRGNGIYLKFANAYSTDHFGGQYSACLFPQGYLVQETDNFPEHTDIEGIVSFAIEHMPTELTEGKGYTLSSSVMVWWCNIQEDWIKYGTLYKMRENDISDIQNGFALGFASGGVVTVGDTGEIDAIEDLIDESGVLEDTEGTVTEKVEELIDKAEELDAFMNITNAYQLFYKAKTFPTKAVVSLPNATNLYQAFSYWSAEPIPIVEELTINAPSIDVSNSQACMGQTFIFNNGVKKVVLNMPNDCQHMNSTFSNAKGLEEVDLNFSTKKITVCANAFNNSTVKKIIGVLDFSSATNVTNMFNNCTNLEEVTFAPNTLSLSISLAQSSKLTSESVQSIIDGLATVETAQTLTLNKAIVLTDEQKSTINAKGWTLAQ